MGNDRNGKRGVYYKARKSDARLRCLADQTTTFRDAGVFQYFEIEQPALDDDKNVVFYAYTDGTPNVNGIFSTTAP